jgi:hypothetical protein
MSVGSSEVGCPGNIDVSGTTFSCVRDKLTFQSDFTLVRHPADGSDDVTGAWSLNGATLTTQFGEDQSEVEIAMSPSGDTFSALNTVDGRNVTFTWVRS